MNRNQSRLLALSMLLALSAFGAARVPGRHSWIITLEEPTGIYRRHDETVTVRLSLEAGLARKEQLRVLAPDGREVPSQVEVAETHADGSIKTADLMFPASILPGDRPEYRLVADPADTGSQPPDTNEITARRIGVGRIEMANARFGIIVNLGLEGTEPAVVSAFSKSAGPQRMLNLVDTSPDVLKPLPVGRKSAGIGTFLPGSKRSGSFEMAEILESGPLRGRVRLSGARLDGAVESWEFIWLAGSPVLKWRASLQNPGAATSYGFFFSSLSAAPYLPFNRWIDGSEETFPSGPDIDDPPDHPIGGSNEKDLPGGHVVYYQREENYGALGIYELDRALEWKGIGARQFYCAAPLSSGKHETETALAFPAWKGTETVLQARMAYRCFTQPILSVVRGPFEDTGGLARQPDGASSGGSVTLNRRSAGDLRSLQGEQSLDISLDGPWRIQWAEKSEGEKQGFHSESFDDGSWRTVQVPGSVHTQILEAPRYFTPGADWISSKEWWYRRSFPVPAQACGKRLRLQFEATDYYADVYLNGKLVGRHEGYMDAYEFDIGSDLRADRPNVLAVRVWAPVNYYWRHRSYTVKGAYGAVDQKPDNITALGITRPVHLRTGGPIVIRDLAVDTRLNSDGSADVLLDLDLDPGREEVQSVGVTVRLTARNFDQPDGLELKEICALEPRLQTRRYRLHVDRPQLWWTWDHGKPNLYTLDVEVLSGGSISDSRSLAVGIREVEHIDWKFYLNGRRMFIRGTNSYYYLFQSDMRRSDYERDLRLIREMNINMIRLHCHFNNPDFYDLADQLGILIWQDYLEAWYPEDTDFSLKAALLYDPLIRYVRNHPSVAIWATSDEESLENYRDLTKHLEPRLYALDPQRRPVVRSTGRYGDGHIYYGWYEGSIWQYTKMTEKFVSELGATALPNYDSLVKFLPDAWPIQNHREEWIFHKLQIPEAMRAWGRPGNLTLREYVPQTQAYVARLFQLAIERMRRLKYNPAGGILHFHAIDIWPSVTMAAIDFYRQPTKAFYTVQRSFQMVLPSLEYDRATWKAGEKVRATLWLINDHWYRIPAVTVSWEVRDSAGKSAEAGTAATRIDLAADSTIRLTDLTCNPPAPGEYSLWARITDGDGRLISENVYEFKVN
jgi:beta-mannosidase